MTGPRPHFAFEVSSCGEFYDSGRTDFRSYVQCGYQGSPFRVFHGLRPRCWCEGLQSEQRSVALLRAKAHEEDLQV